jgi:hypothetical protein
MMDDEASDYMQRNQEKKQKFKEEFEQKLSKEGFIFNFTTPTVEKDRSSAEADPFSQINDIDSILHKGLDEIQEILQNHEASKQQSTQQLVQEI